MTTTTRKCIMVLGMHRSGTSALTRTLSLMGAELPTNLMPPVAGNNETGFWEPQTVASLNDQMLREAGSRWDDWRPFDVGTLPEDRQAHYRNEIHALIESEYAAAPLFVLKDPRISRLVPLYTSVLAGLGVEPLFVLCNRNPSAVVASLAKRDGITEDFGNLVWLRHELEAEAATRDRPRVFVSYEKLLHDWRATVGRIGELLALDWPRSIEKAAQEIEGHLSPDLQHHDPVDIGDTEGSPIKEWVRDAYAAIKLLEANPGDLPAPRTLDRVKRDLDAGVATFGAAFFPELRAREAKAATKAKELQTSLADAISQQAVLEAHSAQAVSELLHKHYHELHDIRMSHDTDRDITVAELAAAESLMAQQANAIDQLTKSVTSMTERVADIEQMKSQSAILRERVAELERQLTEANTNLELALRTSERAENNEKLARKLHRSAIRQSEALRRSTSWRITRPLRGMKRALTEEGFAKRHCIALARALYNRLRLYRALEVPILGGLVLRLKNTLLGVDASPQSAFAPSLSDLKASPPRSPSAKKLRVQELLGTGMPRIIGDPSAEAVSFAKSMIDKAERRPSISVIMPTWNRAATVCDALRSALGQSFPPSEIVVSDDGSTDETISIIERTFPAEVAGGKIKLLRNDHQGVSAARNAALAAASGSLIAYLDSDNTWRPDFLLLVAATFVESDEVSAVYAALAHDNKESGRKMIRGQDFDRARLLRGNFIDLNIFVHRRHLFTQFGGFRRDLTRLVDWDLIIRYTKNYTPVFLPFIGADYYLAPSLNNLTNTQPLAPNLNKIELAHRPERLRLGIEPLRIAYFVYDYPALSQTFVFSEIRELLRRGADVKVYYAVQPEMAAEVDFEVESHKVSNASELAKLFVAHDRNICHSHFAYPGVTNFARPACQATGVYYTFMPHAVDIFHEANRQRSRVGELGADPLCLKVFVYGDFHRKFLEQQGVPRHKVAYTFQAVDLAQFAPEALLSGHVRGEKFRIVAIGRFIEKKGFEDLIRAMALLPPDRFQLDLYGYGPLDRRLRSVVSELGLSNVSFMGTVKGADELSQVYAGAHLLAAPCVEAKNGDIDGFPTVILEAMAAGVPILATSVSAIPDYLRHGVEALLVEPNNPAALAGAIMTYGEMRPSRKAAIVRRAGEFVRRRIGSELTVQRLLDVWLGYEIDIVLVTYNNERYNSRNETLEIISRLLNSTTTNFTLTVIDNDSDESFWHELVNHVTGWENVRLIRKEQNVLCGPASNAAISHGTAEFIFYVCSKEGFVKSHGWERSLVDAMRKCPTAGIAGHLVYLPKHVFGEELLTHPSFHLFRGQSFARGNPRRKFPHVQGGVKVMRRSMFEAAGGYNPSTPQNNMDVELSYYFESLGYELLQLNEVASVTQKTLPGLAALLDEQSVVAHPLHISTVEHRLDSLGNRNLHSCNLCGARFEAFVPGVDPDDVGACPQCGSLSFERLVYRTLANASFTYRGGNCAYLGAAGALHGKLSERMFRHVISDEEPGRFLKKLENGKQYACVIVDPQFIGQYEEPFWKAIAAAVQSGGEIIVAEPSTGHSTVEDLLRPLQRDLSSRSLSVNLDTFDIASEHVGYDWRRLMRLSVMDFSPIAQPETTLA